MFLSLLLFTETGINILLIIIKKNWCAGATDVFSGWNEELTTTWRQKSAHSRSKTTESTKWENTNQVLLFRSHIRCYDFYVT